LKKLNLFIKVISKFGGIPIGIKEFRMAKEKKENKLSYNQEGLLLIVLPFAFINFFISFFAVDDVPYGYWNFVRPAMTFLMSFCAYALNKSTNDDMYKFVFLFFAFMFNPFYVIGLDQIIWGFMHLAIGLIVANCHRQYGYYW